MINTDFDQFKRAQNKHKSNYPGNGERARNTDPKTNQRANTNKNVGATGREME